MKPQVWNFFKFAGSDLSVVANVVSAELAHLKWGRRYYDGVISTYEGPAEGSPRRPQKFTVLPGNTLSCINEFRSDSLQHRCGFIVHFGDATKFRTVSYWFYGHCVPAKPQGIPVIDLGNPRPGHLPFFRFLTRLG